MLLALVQRVSWLTRLNAVLVAVVACFASWFVFDVLRLSYRLRLEARGLLFAGIVPPLVASAVFLLWSRKAQRTEPSGHS